MDCFDTLLSAAKTSGSPEEWMDALALVGDAALICRAWLEEHTPSFTTADLMQMTAMVMTHERDLTRRMERAEDQDPTP